LLSEAQISERVAADAERCWNADLALRLERVDGRTSLVGNVRLGPLYVQRPFYPEGRDHAHVYVLHPPGGIVSGDRLNVDVQLDASAQALFTTPGAGRIYRARPDRRLQQQTNRIEVGTGAICEWLPLENILFDDCNCCLETKISLSQGSRFIGWEVTVLGLPARNEVFGNGSVRQKIAIDCEGVPQLHEQLRIGAQSRELLEAGAGLRGAAVSALLVGGPFDHDASLENALERLRALDVRSNSKEAYWGATAHGRFIVVRYLGKHGEQARALLTAVWRALRPVLLGRDAVAPRIWAT
jgi:urease accessory protein